MRVQVIPPLPVHFLGLAFAVGDVISQLPATAADPPFGMVNPDKLFYFYIAFGCGILSK